MAQDIVQNHYNAIRSDAADYLEGRSDPKSTDDKIAAEINAARQDGTFAKVMLEIEHHNGFFSRGPHVVFSSPLGDDRSEGAKGIYIGQGQFEKTDDIKRQIYIDLSHPSSPPHVHAQEHKGNQWTDPLEDVQKRAEQRQLEQETAKDKARFKPGQDLSIGPGFMATVDELEYKGQAKNVRRLKLGMAGIDDIEVRHLKNFTHLEELSLDWNSVGNDGMTFLKDIKTLNKLSLWHTNVTGAGLKKLAALPNLRELDTNTGRVGDVDIAALKDFPKLDKLTPGEGITDKGLEYIAQIKNLTDLDLYGNHNVTDEGVAELLRKHPLKHLGIWLSNLHYSVLHKEFPDLQITGHGFDDD